MTAATPTASRHAIEEALNAARFYLNATNIPDALALASIMAGRAARLLDNAHADAKQREGAGHAL